MQEADAKGLRQLVSAYFHQDWTEDHDSTDAVLEEFARTNWRGTVEGVIEEISSYLDSHPENLLQAFQADFAPMSSIGTTDQEARDWLSNARQKLLGCLPLAPERKPEEG